MGELRFELQAKVLLTGPRAKTIKNTVKVNKQKSAAELAALIQALRKELISLQDYNTLLEKQIDWMKSPDYDPLKPLPKVAGLLSALFSLTSRRN